jgi:hypothetical protein|tara:strand:+ start:138 stop:512 length:375 start_codon:yes stop_codon:yes gene_type:complete
MSQKAKNDLRHYAGAAGIFILIIFLLLFLSFNEVPPVNKDIFVTVTGMVVGSLSVVIYTIIGRNPDEVDALTKKVDSLQTANDHLVKQKDELEKMVITLQENMIDKISVLGASFIDNLIERKNK